MRPIPLPVLPNPVPIGTTIPARIRFNPTLNRWQIHSHQITPNVQPLFVPQSGTGPTGPHIVAQLTDDGWRAIGPTHIVVGDFPSDFSF